MASVKLSKISTRAPKGWDKDTTKHKLQQMLTKLDELQNLLYAERKHSILIVLQGMDAAGKDGLIRDVFTSMNPQGVQVTSFKEPTPEELSHDFLWRIHQHAPACGMIQVFNRSHYEDVLVTRVHRMIDDKTAKKRMDAINDFERLLQENNATEIIKIYLHVSQEEQQKRLKERLSKPEKMWKYNAKDLSESDLWDTYVKYYDEAISYCNKPEWHIVPTDQNWYKSYLVARILLDKLQSLKMKYPGLKK
ncbi:MAG: polyphosphate kinase [Bacteroidetes bacterium]|nr:polyphosphate kinase [Bacteroidota bacterium]